ncbi:hypothetical protein MRX96_055878 [Rhipicephalus microplus]
MAERQPMRTRLAGWGSGGGFRLERRAPAIDRRRRARRASASAVLGPPGGLPPTLTHSWAESADRSVTAAVCAHAAHDARRPPRAPTNSSPPSFVFIPADLFSSSGFHSSPLPRLP